MRKSTKFLLNIPVLFSITVVLVFIFLFSFFKLIESMAVATTPISDYLVYFSLILATLIAIDGLIMLIWEFVSQRREETKLERYLARVDNKDFE